MTIFVFLISALFVSQFTVAILVNKISGATFLVLWLLFSRRFIFNPVVVCYLCFIGWCVIGFPGTNGDWKSVMEHLQTMILLVGILLLITGLLNEHNSLVPIAIVMVAYFAFAYFGGLLGFETNSDQKRLQGVTANANTLGFICLYGLVAGLYLVDRLEYRVLRILKEHIWILFVLFAILILPTGSRKAFISLAGLFIAHLMILSQANSKRIITILVVLGIGFAFSSNYIFEWFEGSQMGQRFLDKSSFESGANIRSSLYQQGFQLFLQNPICGVGLNNFQRYSNTGHVAHSYYVGILADTGIIGFFILLFAYSWVFRQSKRLFYNRAYVPEANFILGFLAVIFIMSFGYSYHRSFDQWIFLTLIASFLANPLVKPFTIAPSRSFANQN